MSLPVKSQQELYDLFITTLTNAAPELTDLTEGSDIDTMGGTFSLAAAELTRIIINEFNKTFIDLANGPDITGGPDDLQTLAVDHYGESFARPGAIQAVDTATFTRANNSKGQVTILTGSIVKTLPDANGSVQRYATLSDLVLTANSSGSDLIGVVSIKAVVEGKAGNAAAGTITVIETALTDESIVVTNTGNATGSDAQDDSVYRETIRNLIKSLAGATAAAIAAKALTISGVVTATPIEQALTVIQYDVASSSVVGSPFRFPVPILYIADATGTASAALLAEVQTILDSVRACGVLIQVKAASALTLNWTASFTLNPSGPNYSVFVSNPSQILQAMTDYVNGIAVGTGFVRATANAAMLALFGPAGTNDLTAFTTSVPSGDVAATASQKLVAGTIAKS